MHKSSSWYHGMAHGGSTAISTTHIVIMLTLMLMLGLALAAHRARTAKTPTQ